MKLQAIIVFIAVMFMSCLVGSSYGGTDELSKYLESKEYWKSFDWNDLKASQVYKLQQWVANNSTKIDLDSISEKHTTTFILSCQIDLSIINKSSYSKLSDTLNARIEHTDKSKYNEWLSTLESLYGNVHSSYDGSIVTATGETLLNIVNQWDVGNTIVELSYYESNDNGTNKVINLVYGDKDLKFKVEPPYMLSCEFNKREPSIFKNDPVHMVFTIDELNRRVLREDRRLYSRELKVTDNYLEFEGNNSFKAKINKATGRLEGIKLNEDSIEYDGTCNKLDHALKKS